MILKNDVAVLLYGEFRSRSLFGDRLNCYRHISKCDKTSVTIFLYLQTLSLLASFASKLNNVEGEQEREENEGEDIEKDEENQDDDTGW